MFHNLKPLAANGYTQKHFSLQSMIFDPEIEAIAKCTDVLKDLSSECKIRVIQYLINRFKLSEDQSSIAFSSNGIDNGVKPLDEKSGNNDQLENQLDIPVARIEANTQYPSLRQVVLKQLPASEPEWVLVYAFYSSDFGRIEFTRPSLLAKYTETNRKTDNRVKNISNSIKQCIDKDWIVALNDNDFLVGDTGKEKIEEIIKRTAASKPKKPIKSKGNKQLDNE